MPDIDFAAPIVSLCRQPFCFRHHTDTEPAAKEVRGDEFHACTSFAWLRMSRSHADERDAGPGDAQTGNPADREREIAKRRRPRRAGHPRQFDRWPGAGWAPSQRLAMAITTINITPLAERSSRPAVGLARLGAHGIGAV